MRQKIHRVFLTDDDRAVLYRLLAGGTAPARQLTHARILLKTDEGLDGPAWTDTAIADALEIDRATVGRVRRQFVLGGRGAALRHRPPRATKPRTLSGADEAHLIALACSAPPIGRERWSVRLLAAQFVTVEEGARVSRELVRRTLKKARSSRG
ncbi:MAG: helix-turn-helix domain-containing protein [Chloroflexota bacterium]|nr:helix-turn-helix domain-containing protein [Chloroflexota bacterium]